MTISNIIEKYYYDLKAKCHNDDIAISMGRTSEDILQDVCLTALRKFKTKDIDEQIGLSYLEKTLWYELKFQKNRIDSKVVFVDDLLGVDKGIED